MVPPADETEEQRGRQRQARGGLALYSRNDPRPPIDHDRQITLDRTGQPDQDRTAVRRAAALADDVTKRLDHFVQRLLGGRPARIARNPYGRPDVLLVHPAIEDAD